MKIFEGANRQNVSPRRPDGEERPLSRAHLDKVKGIVGHLALVSSLHSAIYKFKIKINKKSRTKQKKPFLLFFPSLCCCGRGCDSAKGHTASLDNNMAFWLPPSSSSFSFRSSYPHPRLSTLLTSLPFCSLSVLSDGHLNTTRGRPLPPCIFAHLGYHELFMSVCGFASNSDSILHFHLKKYVLLCRLYQKSCQLHVPLTQKIPHLFLVFFPFIAFPSAVNLELI